MNVKQLWYVIPVKAPMAGVLVLADDEIEAEEIWRRAFSSGTPLKIAPATTKVLVAA